MQPNKSAYNSMALTILSGLATRIGNDCLPVVINQSAIDTLSTRTEKNLPEYEHEPLTKALWKLIKDGRKEESSVHLGKGFWDVTILVREARGEYLKQQIDFFERMARMHPEDTAWSEAVGHYRALYLGWARSADEIEQSVNEAIATA